MTRLLWWRKPAKKAPVRRGKGQPTRRASTPAAERYESLTREMLSRHHVRVRKWRTSMSGVAWQTESPSGAIGRWIEAPRPKGPMSAAVFLHEIGHHAIGFKRYRPRCLEEYHAWLWSLGAMGETGVKITERVEQRVHMSLHYAVDKARRRGLKRLPAELAPFVEPPQRSGGSEAARRMATQAAAARTASRSSES